MKLLPFGPIGFPPDLKFLATHQRSLVFVGAMVLAVAALWMLRARLHPISVQAGSHHGAGAPESLFCPCGMGNLL